MRSFSALTVWVLTTFAGALASLPHLSGYSVVEPEKFNLLRRSGDSTLHEIVLPNSTEYTLGKILVANLTGDREELGRAYAELLGTETIDVYKNFMTSLLGNNSVLKAAFGAFADWSWTRYYSKHVPKGYIDELNGMKKASPKGQGITVDQVSSRFSALANMPADPKNIITALEYELEKGLPSWEASLLNSIINHLDHCTWCVNTPQGLRVPFSAGCDAFGIWGSRTKNGELFTSRNLDWSKDTGTSKHKLVTITHTPGSHAYASFGFATGFGALAGMSERGITTSEMNLDNSMTSFDGPPFPLRFRMILEGTNDLASAKALWEATNNTDSMNYLIGSAKDNAAMAIEAMRGYSGFFKDNDAVEASATCTLGTKRAGTCGDGFQDKKAHDGKKKIGSPLADAVWRTNHAVDPKHMLSQEPLSNDTTFRYTLLHDLIQEYETQGVAISSKQAISIVASLGIKGPNFLSCDRSQFSKGINVLSVMYQPVVGAGSAYAAWEDGTGDSWTPAACKTYVHLDFAQWWGMGSSFSMVV